MKLRHSHGPWRSHAPQNSISPLSTPKWYASHSSTKDESLVRLGYCQCIKLIEQVRITRASHNRFCSHSFGHFVSVTITASMCAGHSRRPHKSIEHMWLRFRFIFELFAFGCRWSCWHRLRTTHERTHSGSVVGPLLPFQEFTRSIVCSVFSRCVGRGCANKNRQINVIKRVPSPQHTEVNMWYAKSIKWL